MKKKEFYDPNIYFAIVYYILGIVSGMSLCVAIMGFLGYFG